MTREVEVRTGIRIDAALDRVRSKISSMGMAGKWHLGKASDVLQSVELLRRDVQSLGEHEEAKYLDHLPCLIAETREQNWRCAECSGTQSATNGTKPISG